MQLPFLVPSKKSLINYVNSFIDLSEAVNLRLEVTPDNARAKKWYEKLVFTLRENSANEMGLD